MLPAHLGRIELQLFSNLVEMDFERIPRLRRTVPSLWSTGRLICKDAGALEFIARHFVRHRLQRAGVERARDAVAAVRATVEKRFEVNRRDRATFFLARAGSVH